MIRSVRSLGLQVRDLGRGGSSSSPRRAEAVWAWVLPMSEKPSDATMPSVFAVAFISTTSSTRLVTSNWSHPLTGVTRRYFGYERSSRPTVMRQGTFWVERPGRLK